MPVGITVAVGAIPCKAAVPVWVSCASTSASQPETSPGLLAVSGTAVPLAHVGVVVVWAVAVRMVTTTKASNSSPVTARAGSVVKWLRSRITEVNRFFSLRC